MTLNSEIEIVVWREKDRTSYPYDPDSKLGETQQGWTWESPKQLFRDIEADPKYWSQVDKIYAREGGSRGPYRVFAQRLPGMLVPMAAASLLDLLPTWTPPEEGVIFG